MGEDFIALKRQSATTTTTHGQMFCCIREHPNHFSLKSEQKHDFYIETDKQDVFPSIFPHIFVYQGHMF